MGQQELSIVARKFSCLSRLLNERERRLWAAAEAMSIPYGGVSLVARATGLSRTTIHAGMRELQHGPQEGIAPGQSRRAGGGQKPLIYHHPGLLEALAKLVTSSSPAAASPLLWTCKSTRHLASELRHLGYQIGDRKVADLLHEMQYRLHAKPQTSSKDEFERNAQFEYINRQTQKFLSRDLPVISVEIRKKEITLRLGNDGKEQRQTEPGKNRVHGYVETEPQDLISSGGLPWNRDPGWLIIGVDGGTAEFTLDSVLSWWKHMASRSFPHATELLIVADTGEKANRSQIWKMIGQHLADLMSLQIHVSHFPPGTSKWNNVERRMSWFTIQNWQENSMVAWQVIVNLIGSVKANAPREGRTEVARSRCAGGFEFRTSETTKFILQPASFGGDWNYTLLPHGMQCSNGRVPRPVNSSRS